MLVDLKLLFGLVLFIAYLDWEFVGLVLGVTCFGFGFVFLVVKEWCLNLV